MASTTNSGNYYIWGIDLAAYGPVPLPTLLEWVRDERVVADTWIFIEAELRWRPARELLELLPELNRMANAGPAGSVPGRELKPGALRRIKILAGLSDQQLAHLAQFLEPLTVENFVCVCRQGEIGDGMYLVLEGELRVRQMNGQQEKILATLGAGEFFGDMSLFDRGPRSADVVANANSLLFKMSLTNFERLLREAPALATPILQASVRTLSARIRANNKQLDNLSLQYSAIADP